MQVRQQCTLTSFIIVVVCMRADWLAVVRTQHQQTEKVLQGANMQLRSAITEGT